ncbi:EpsG family protein [Proteiniphilum sp.]|uniref:EpsG family protein n=1 Tax=Proteiniphilum sp. TaxID=1926877 RepID=UPI003331DA6D
MNKNIKLYAYRSFFLFIISPFLSLPFIFIDIYNRKKGALLCLALFMGILTYLLLPDWSLDLARYYQSYELIKEYSFEEFKNYLSLRSDYVYYFLFFIFSRVGVKFQILLFCLSTFNFYILFYIYNKVAVQCSISNKEYFKKFILYLFSIAILYYLSATRNSLACSFFLLFAYNYYFLNRKKRGIILLITAIITHISFLVYVPIMLIISLIKNKKGLIISSLLIFFLFSVIPVERFLNVFIGILPGFTQKAFIYLAEDRIGHWTLVLSHYLIILLGLIFLISFYKKLDIRFLTLLTSLILAVILVFPFGFITYDRYTFAFKPVLVLGLVICSSNIVDLHSKRILYLIEKTALFSFLLYFTYSFYLYRYNIMPYFSFENMFLLNILSTEYTLQDIFFL